jgi:hypothetical protein
MIDTTAEEPTYSRTEIWTVYKELLADRDELLTKLADERRRNSDLQNTVNSLEQQLAKKLTIDS